MGTCCEHVCEVFCARLKCNKLYGECPTVCLCPARHVQRSLKKEVRSQRQTSVRRGSRSRSAGVCPLTPQALCRLTRSRPPRCANPGPTRVHGEAKNKINMVIDKNTHNVSRLAAAHGHGTVSSTAAWTRPGLSSWHGGYAASDSPCAWGGGLRRRQRKEARRSPCV